MKNKHEIKLPENISSFVEKCWFEWQGINDILAYITKNNACVEHIEYYTQLSLEKKVVLEEAKTKIANEYIPDADKISYKYEFDFNNGTLVYWEVE